MSGIFLLNNLFIKIIYCIFVENKNNMWDSVKVFDSSEGNVWKYVFTKPDVVAEAVLYQYESFEKRTVICCSVQSGCPVGCGFCGTGKKFIRNLTTEEIVTQIEEVLKSKGLQDSIKYSKKFQIMFMSMGEPFLNYSQVENALILLSVLYPTAQLLVSTIGVNSSEHFINFLELSKANKNIGLQFSIHEALDARRNILIPYKNKLTLRQIRDYGIKWNKVTGRPVYLNYCVTEENTKFESIVRLKDLFSPECFYFTFSVICESNETMKGKSYKLHDHINDIMSSFVCAGYNVRKFDPAGQDDIGGGCGQLWYVQDFLKHK